MSIKLNVMLNRIIGHYRSQIGPQIQSTTMFAKNVFDQVRPHLTVRYPEDFGPASMFLIRNIKAFVTVGICGNLVLLYLDCKKEEEEFAALEKKYDVGNLKKYYID